MGQALYRKYRSKSLDEIVGQSHITEILRRAVSSGNIAHAYLLTGPRGVGKTSIARILAHEINRLPYDETSTHVDIIEIDAASNNSVDDVRDLREKVQLAPVQAPKKIYIIDEVHMLSKPAFNALLKTLEEPPEHIVFILATTDADKLPATIISRVQRFNFRSISPADAEAHLRHIAEAEQIAIDDEALTLIARRGGGSFRDSIGLLDQLQNLGSKTISSADIEALLGIAGDTEIAGLLSAYQQNDLRKIAATLTTLESEAVPAATIAEQLIQRVSQLLPTQPELAALLDKLTDVTRSSWPYIKLLVALTPAQPVSTPNPAPAKNPDVKKTPAPIEPPETTSPAAPETPSETAPTSDFSWNALLTSLKDKETGLYTLLSKAGYQFDGSKLTIYCVRQFNKNRVDKSLPALAGALESLGYTDLQIITEPTAKPPEDSQAASIIAMMGGGEPVDPDA